MKWLAFCFALCACDATDLDRLPLLAAPARANQALKDAQAEARPGIVAVRANVGGVDNWCTGITLEPSLVLTAEHCLAQAFSPGLTFDCATAVLPAIATSSLAWVTGASNVNDASSAEYIAVSNVLLPNGDAKLCGDDLALLELAQPITTAAPMAITATLVTGDARFTAVGYGTDGQHGGIQRQNEGARVLCVGVQCNDPRIADRELLANSGACEGDSGSPALDAEGRAFATAARSSADCAQTAYLSLAPHLTWLASTAVTVAQARGMVAPDWAVVTAGLNDAGANPLQPDADVTASSMPPSDCECALHRSRHQAMWPLALLALAVSTRALRRVRY